MSAEAKGARELLAILERGDPELARALRAYGAAWHRFASRPNAVRLPSDAANAVTRLRTRYRRTRVALARVDADLRLRTRLLRLFDEQDAIFEQMESVLRRPVDKAFVHALAETAATQRKTLAELKRLQSALRR